MSNRIVKIQDPERISREFVSNAMSGSHSDDVLDQNIDSYLTHKKQLIILTAAGKPVYSYGRDEEDLARLFLFVFFYCRCNRNYSGFGFQFHFHGRAIKVIVNSTFLTSKVY